MTNDSNGRRVFGCRIRSTISGAVSSSAVACQSSRRCDNRCTSPVIVASFSASASSTLKSLRWTGDRDSIHPHRAGNSDWRKKFTASRVTRLGLIVATTLSTPSPRIANLRMSWRKHRPPLHFYLRLDEYTATERISALRLDRNQATASAASSRGVLPLHSRGVASPPYPGPRGRSPHRFRGGIAIQPALHSPTTGTWYLPLPYCAP